MYMEKPHTFYLIYKIDEDTDQLKAGYYRYIYDLTGAERSDPCCHFSTDRYDWTECTQFKSLGDFQDFFDTKIDPKPMKIEHEDYIETIHYRGVDVPIFCDDYGQCFYCIFNGETMAFGSFQSEYEDEVRHLIDYELGKKAKR